MGTGAPPAMAMASSSSAWLSRSSGDVSAGRGKEIAGGAVRNLLEQAHKSSSARRQGGRSILREQMQGCKCLRCSAGLALCIVFENF